MSTVYVRNVKVLQHDSFKLFRVIKHTGNFTIIVVELCCVLDLKFAAHFLSVSLSMSTRRQSLSSNMFEVHNRKKIIVLLNTKYNSCQWISHIMFSFAPYSDI